MLYLAFTWKDIQMMFNLTISGWKIAAEVFKYPSANVPTWKWHGSVAERWFQWCWLIKLPNLLYTSDISAILSSWIQGGILISSTSNKQLGQTDHRKRFLLVIWWDPRAALWAEKRLGDGQKVGRWRVAGLLKAVVKEHGHGWPCSTALNSSLQDFRCGHWMHLFLGTQTELEQVQLTKFAESDFTNFLSIVFGTSDNFRWFSARPKNKFATLRGEQRHRVRQSPQVFPVSLW